MNAELLLAHFERISEAPDAVPRLRRFILDLAVRGKLVEQDPNDEPASELLKRIKLERARQTTKVAARKNRSGGQVDVVEPPFVLPESWEWSTLGEIARYGLPDKVDSNREISPDTWVLDLEDIEKDTSRLVERVTSSSRPFQSSKTKFKQGDVLFGKLRPYLNKVIVADVDGVCTTEIVPVRGASGVVPEFTRLVLKSPLTMERVDRLMYGMKMPRLGTDDALLLSFPLSPTAEQHRIVAKVDELMALCDRLEAAQAKRERRRDRLVAASLERLNNGSDAEEFQERARFNLSNLPRVTTRPEHIQQLRQTILYLAVRGRLVEQDPNDEPAFELLKRIRVEKSRRLDAKRLIREKPLPIIVGEDSPFELPTGWVWTRWESIALKIGDIDHRMPETVPDGVPYISPRDFLPGNRINFDGAKRVSFDDFVRLSAKMKPEIGDLIYPRYGTIGENRLVDEPRDFLVSYSCAVVKVLSEFIDPMYQYLFSISPFCKQQAKAAENKTTQANVGIESIKRFVFPLPPLAEQHRIVAKVDELMAVCDRLEAQLSDAQAESRRLLEAVFYHSLEDCAARAFG